MQTGSSSRTRPKFPNTVEAVIPVVLLLLATLASGQSIVGNTITGKARRQTGQPAANVLIQLETGNGIPITQTVTGNEGDFAFSGLEGATFTLIVNDPQYQHISERVEFQRGATGRAGETQRIDIVLVRHAESAVPPGQLIFRQDVPENALRAYQRGVKLLADGKSNDGLAELASALSLYPRYFDAHFARGLELLRLKRHDDAVHELEAARQINPKDARVYHTFGLVLFEQKKYALAASVFAAAVQLNPADAEAQLMRGAALIDVGNLDEAEAALARADQVSLHKLPIVHLHLARVFEKRGDRRKAAEELERYLKLVPDASNAAAIREAIKTLRAPGEKKP